MELKIVEPDLGLRVNADAPNRLAGARRLKLAAAGGETRRVQ